MRFPRNAKIFRGQLDAAPFAGFFFVLLILFLLNFRMALTPGVAINLPQVSSDLPGVANAILLVAIDANGQFYYENQSISEDRLLERLQTAVQSSSEPLTLVIQSDARAKVDFTTRLLSVAPRLGIERAHFFIAPASRLPQAPAPPEKQK